MNHQLGFFNRPWNRWSFDRALEGIAASGARYVGLMRQQGVLPLDHSTTGEGLSAVASAISGRGLTPLVALAGIDPLVSLDAGVAAFRRTLDNLHAAGVKHVLTLGMSEPAEHEYYFDLVAGTIDYAAGLGITIGLKPHGGLSATGAHCRKAVDRVARPNFGIWYDPGNMLYYEGIDPTQDVPSIAEHVVGVCVKDCAGGKGGNVEITPGDGAVDFEAVFRTLAGAGFGGPCLIETLGGETPEQVDAAAVKAYGYIQGILEQI